MIKVIIRNNIEPTVVLVPGTATVRSVLEDNNIEYARKAIHLEGDPVEGADLDRSFESFGQKDTWHLGVVAKTDNA